MNKLNFFFGGPTQIDDLLKGITQKSEKDLIENTELWMTSKNLKLLPSCIILLTQLKSLNVSYNRLEKLPEDIGKLNKLERLLAFNNQLKTIPSSIGSLTQLNRLDLQYNTLSHLPPQVANLSSLSRLDLRHNLLKQIPLEFGCLKSLEVLNMSNNQLSHFPSALSSLHQLQSLLLNGNQFTEISDSFSGLQTLERLELRNNLIEEIPVHILRHFNLKKLNVSRNQIKIFPHTEVLLCEINLSENRLEVLPLEICFSPRLQVIDIQENEIKSLPIEIGGMPELQIVRCGGNPLENELLPIVESGDEEALQIYLRNRMRKAKLVHLSAFVLRFSGTKIQVSKFSSLPPFIQRLFEFVDLREKRKTFLQIEREEMVESKRMSRIRSSSVAILTTTTKETDFKQKARKRRSGSGGGGVEIYYTSRDEKAFKEHKKKSIGVFQAIQNLRVPEFGQKKKRGSVDNKWSLFRTQEQAEPIAVFGKSIEQLQENGPLIPLILMECINFLTKEKNIRVEGLFRVCPVQSELDQLKGLYVDPREMVGLESVTESPHAVAGLMKAWFAQLSDPLFSFDIYDSLIAIFRNATSDKALINFFQKVMRRIPKERSCIIMLLFDFCHRLVLHPQNKMTAQNVGIVFGPNIVRPKIRNATNLIDTDPARLVEFILDHYDEIFHQLAEDDNFNDERSSRRNSKRLSHIRTFSLSTSSPSSPPSFLSFCSSTSPLRSNTPPPSPTTSPSLQEPSPSSPLSPSAPSSPSSPSSSSSPISQLSSPSLLDVEKNSEKILEK